MAKLGLVTGCAGFIGSHLCDRLLLDGWEVIGLDDLSTGNMENIAHLQGNKKFRFFNVDITDPKAFEALKFGGVDCIFHHAGKKMVFSVRQPREDLLTNISGTLNMLMWAVANGAKRFIMASSIAVYGNPKSPPSAEDSAIAPTNPYGVSKRSCELYCQLWHSQYNLPVIIFRYASVYGPRQALNVGVVNAFIQKIRDNQTVTIFGDGSNTRPFTYVSDIVEANMLAANTADTSLFGQIFNVSMDKSVSVSEMVGAICGKMKKTPKVVHEKERVGEIRHMVADISKIRRLLKFEPKVSVKEGIARTVEFHEKSAM